MILTLEVSGTVACKAVHTRRIGNARSPGILRNCLRTHRHHIPRPCNLAYSCSPRHKWCQVTPSKPVLTGGIPSRCPRSGPIRNAWARKTGSKVLCTSRLYIPDRACTHPVRSREARNPMGNQHTSHRRRMCRCRKKLPGPQIDLERQYPRPA